MEHYQVSRIRYNNQTHLRCSCGAEFSDYLEDEVIEEIEQHIVKEILNSPE
jgi:hypothetical protein